MKLFCIGLNKTGTTSLEHAWKILGYDNICSPALITAQSVVTAGFRKDYRLIFDLVDHYDAFKDRPFNTEKLYKIIDKHIPDSKFILTVRDPEHWWNSVNKWLSYNHPYHPTENERKYKIEIYKRHFNASQLNKTEFLDYYVEYNTEVINWFKGRTNFIIMDICNGDGWDILCPFLDKKIPSMDFPKTNVNTYGKAI